MIAAAAPRLSQAERIRRAAQKSVRARNLYADQTASGVTQSLKSAQEEVAKAILRYKSLGSLPDNKLAALKGLDKLNGELGDILSAVKKDQTVAFRKSTKAAFRQGVYDGVGEFAAAQMPFYRDLTPTGIDKLTTRVFTLVDTDALDFMVNYNVVLAGDVHRELADGIKRTIMSGIATGKGADDIVRDLGHVIVDKDSFRQAGTRVFSKAQYRMEMIARTEVLRAHNQGRLKFHQRVGVQKLEWLAMEDERMCPVCGGLDGKVFLTDKFPQQPAHPHCRCTHVVAWPMDICGLTPMAKADGEPAACILPPQTLEKLADAKAEEDAKLKSAFESGAIGDLNGLTVKQLQTLAKQNGIAIARTKADFIALLDTAEPGITHGDLGGEALKAKLAQYKIGALRSKEDLVALLAQKQAAIKQDQQVAKQVAQLPPTGGLHELTVKDLQEMAKSKGISLNMTKQDVIELLDQIEPGVDHGGLSGDSLIAAKQKLGVGVLKNKQQLVHALEKAAGQELAEKAKQEATNAALQKTKAFIEEQTAKVVLPAGPEQFASFMASVHDAEVALAMGTGLPQEYLEFTAKELALKKKVFQDQLASMNAVALKDLVKAAKVKNWQWGSKQDFITILSETDPVKVQSVHDKLAAGYQAHQAKYGKKKSQPATVPPLVKTPSAPPAWEPAPSPVPAPPVFAKKGSEFVAVDESWETTRGKPANFTFEKSAKDAGGVHAKEFWLDGEGSRWMFKPADNPLLAHSEEMAYRLGRLVDPEAIEVRVIALNGRVGTIQKMKTGLRPDYDFRDLADLSALTREEIEQLQREHVIDWFVSNHDNHPQQFIRTVDGRLYGVDKGQAGKFLGRADEELRIGYNPNSNHGSLESLYDRMFRAAKAGQIQVDPSAALRYIREIEQIPDDVYLDAVRAYADARFGRNEAARKSFLDMLLARKQRIRPDFERYYGEVTGKKDFRFEADIPVPRKGRLGKQEMDIVEDAAALGWQGKTLPIDADEVEDQNALIFTESFGGKKRTVVKLKMRPDADGRILESLKQGAMDRSNIKVGEPLAEDRFAQDILLAVKTTNHHAQDGSYNQSKLDAARKHRAALTKLLKSGDPDVKEMAETYLQWLDRVDEAVTQRQKVGGGNFEAYLRKRLPARDDKKAPPFTVRKTKVQSTRRELRKNDVSVLDDAATNSTMFNGDRLKDGEQYEITFPDGTRVRYTPWSGANLYAQQGELELAIAGAAEPDTVERALEHLGSLGVDASIASPQHAEWMYLRKLAYIRKEDQDGEYVSLLGDLDKRGAAMDERVQALRGFWEHRLGVPDLTRLPGYNPLGEYQYGHADAKRRGGYRHQYRFDLSDEDLERQMKGYTLKHSLTNRTQMGPFIETLLDNNGAMISTVEKMRAGVVPGGMSPEADMSTGGATYFFTRIKKLGADGKPKDTGLYFKKRLLRRMDAISYDGDKYGRCTDDTVREQRHSTVDGWKHCARQGSNETIFKYSVTLLDNIEFIQTASAQERDRVLRAFTSRGITLLPDGRRIESMVL